MGVAPRCVAAVLLVVVLGGCVADLGDASARRPTSAPTAWSETGAKPWIAGTTGCGFCSGNVNVSEVRTVVVYESGEVLWFEYGAGSGQAPGGGSLEVASGLEAYKAELTELKATLRNYYVDGRHVKVHDVAPGVLMGDEWRDIRTYLERAVSEAQDPGPPIYDCEDCGAYHAEVLADERRYEQLRGNFEEGDPWDRLMGQLRFIEEWVSEE